AIVALVGLGAGPVRPPLSPARLSLLLWAGWALTYAVVYSYAGGIFHFYYLSTLGPPLAALAAVGVAEAWARYRSGGARGVLLPGALLVTALWQVYVHSAALPLIADDWQRRLPIWTLSAAVLASIALVALMLRPAPSGLATRAAGAALG